MRALLILSEEKSYYRNFKYLPENIDNIEIKFNKKIAVNPNSEYLSPIDTRTNIL